MKSSKEHLESFCLCPIKTKGKIFVFFMIFDGAFSPSTIVVKRSGMKDGFACFGDSGGPIVVKHSGRFVLAALVSTVPTGQILSAWPPPCLCNCEVPGETHARVSAAVPWIEQVMIERKLSFSCT